MDAKNSLDSLIVYASEEEIKDTLIANYDYIAANLTYIQNTVDAYKNQTYYYSIEDMIDNLKYFIINKTVPNEALKKACFSLLNEECTLLDTAFFRSLNDTTNDNKGNSKHDYLNFHLQVSKKTGDTIVILSLRFFDDSSYSFYKNELSQFSKFHSFQKSKIYNSRSQDENGNEYLISEPLISGLTFERLNNTIVKGYTQMYRLYFYCILNNGMLKDLSATFD